MPSGPASMNQDLIATFARLGVRDVEVSDDVDKALARITAIYEAAVERLRVGPRADSKPTATPPGPIEAFYPFVGLSLEAGRAQSRWAYSPTAPCTIQASTARR